MKNKLIEITVEEHENEYEDRFIHLWTNFTFDDITLSIKMDGETLHGYVKHEYVVKKIRLT